MEQLTQAELDRIHAVLFSDEEKLRTNYDGSCDVEIDAADIEEMVDTAPETAYELFEAIFNQQTREYEYSDKYFGKYTEHANGEFTHEPFTY